MGYKALVVEDEIFVATEIEGILSELGHQAIGIASDSRRALALGKDAELAFVDLNLIDGASGIEIGKRLAASGVTVLYMTANPSQLGSGVPGTVGVLPKPFNDRELRQAIEYVTAYRQNRPGVAAPRAMRLFANTSVAA
jgi:DNA-binding response OmpR family regulator